MKRTLAFFSLFTSLGTLVCCALPALFVALGFGAALAGIVGNVPQLIWLSENKLWIFGAGAVLLAGGAFLQWRAGALVCPIDPVQGEACASARDWSRPLYLASLVIYAIGAFFAFVAPRLF